MQLRLRKSIILRGYRSFSRTLSTGKTLNSKPLRCFYLIEPSGESRLQVGFSVSRSVRHAVVRNRLRRLMREALRKNMKFISDGSAKRGLATIVFMYTGTGESDHKRVTYGKIEKSIVQLLQSLRENL